MTSPASVTTLPPLNAVERVHSERVVDAHPRLHREQGGVIGFDAYMRLALYAPGLGYYSAGAANSAATAISSRRRKSRVCSRVAWRARSPTSSR